MTRLRLLLMVWLAIWMVPVVGCKKEDWDKLVSPKSDSTTKPATDDEAADDNDDEIPPEVRGTIAEKATLVSSGDRPIGSWGVIIGLGKDGSSEVPPSLRSDLYKYINGVIKLGSQDLGTGRISAREFLDDKDTGVVRVDAVIPPGAPKGTMVDVVVHAWPGTQTIDISGGILLPIELRWERGMAGRRQFFTSYGKAEGPVFVNPFIDLKKPADRAKLRKGRILNGCEVTVDMPLRLQLYRPSYSMANILQRRIEERFTSRGQKIATAKSSSYLELHIPSEYRGNYTYFLQLLMHLPYRGGAGHYTEMAKRVGKKMANPNVNPDSLALIWEAMGREVLPIIQRLYSSSDRKVQYFSARAGLRLGDRTLAGPIVLQFANAKDSPYRLLAIEELGKCAEFLQAGQTLRAMLNEEDELVRVTAYEALLKRGDFTSVERSKIDTGKFNEQKPAFLLDEVSSSQRYAIYATRTGQPRIALLGKNMPIKNPLFYSSSDESVMILSQKALPKAKWEEYEQRREMELRQLRGVDKARVIRDEMKMIAQDHIVVYRKLGPSGDISDKFRIPFRVAELVKVLGGTPRVVDKHSRVEGLGFTYGQVVGILAQLSKDGSIPAKFVLQQLPEIQRIYKSIPTEDRTERPDE